MPLLGHTTVVAPSAVAERWMLFLHGIYGTGANWRTFARRFVTARPRWGAVLVDLRKHGASQDFSPPHTLATAAADLGELLRALPGPVAGVLGHSFGGKVALRHVQDRRGDLDVAWVIDSTPGPRPDARGSEDVLHVLDALRTLGPAHPSREAFIQRLEGLGFSHALGQWLAMNLRPAEGGYHLQMDLDAIAALLDDYFRQDLWSVLEHPPGRVRVHLVIGGRSHVVSPEDRDRAERGQQQTSGRVQVHVLPSSGHDVHVDDPDGLLRLLVEEDRRLAALGGVT